MASTQKPGLFQRKSLDQITSVPDDLISVYSVEKHIWAEGGSPEARAARRPENRTVEEFLIDPVRTLLERIFRQVAAPWDPARRDNPIGQGYWVQAEFGSGKSHLLSFVGALALGDPESWEIVRQKEAKAGKGRRESLYTYYENGLRQKAEAGKGVLVVVKTLVGQGSGTVGVEDSGKPLVNYVLDAVAEQFYAETGRSLPLYPVELLADRFLNRGDLERYRRDLSAYLQDPHYFDPEEQEDITEFITGLQDTSDPATRRDCGQRLWRFYTEYLQVRPEIAMGTEDVLEHAVRQITDEGYAGLLLIIDEVSLFMRNRTERERGEDEDTLIALANRLAKVKNLPVWTVCAAQQAIESRMAGVKNIHADERLMLYPLLSNEQDYYDIALQRVREITDPAAIDAYYEDYSRAFTWPQAVGRDRFARFFPFYPPSIDVVRAISYHLTTVRSALYFMLQTIKARRLARSRELIGLWSLFDVVADYEEDPSGTNRGITSVRTKWPEPWQAYERAVHALDSQTKGRLKVYRTRCDKIVRTLFLYHVAELAPQGLTHEEFMNNVMEWKDHESGQSADLDDNLGHYEILAEDLVAQLVEVAKEGDRYRFVPSTEGKSPQQLFDEARQEVLGDEPAQEQAWEALLALDGWQVRTGLMTVDLASTIRSMFCEIAPQGQTNLEIVWHNRKVAGRALMRDLVRIAGSPTASLPSVNSSETGQDFFVFVSSRQVEPEMLDALVAQKRDPRILFWAPDALTTVEQSLLVDWASYRSLVRDHAGQETQKAQEVLGWVQGRLQQDMGAIANIVRSAYARGRMAALDHSTLPFACEGNLQAILTPIIGRLLDDVYVSKELEFDAPAPLDDVNIVHVMNGIVRTGEIPRGARPSREVSAAQNYGFGLQIMRPPNDHRLDLTGCRYTKDMGAWIEARLEGGEGALPVTSLYKNFCGIGGPNNTHYGLSRRLVQLYILCLVREGSVRVTLSGRGLSVDALDYADLASVEIRAPLLDAFHEVELLRAPEGWEALAPYAAVLLGDPAVREAQQDADIQTAVERLLRWREEQAPGAQRLRDGLRALFDDLGLPNPLDERLAAWAAFLTARVERTEPIAYLRRALDKAFSYHAYATDEARPDEVDDLATRAAEVAHATTLFGYRDRLRPVARYAAYDLPDDPALADIAHVLGACRGRLERLSDYIGNEAGLLSEVLEPAEEALRSYATRYLQTFERVNRETERAREEIAALEQDVEYLALGRLAQVPQLGADPRPGLQEAFAEHVGGLLPGDATYDRVQRELREWPEPPCTPLTLANAARWQEAAAEAREACRAALYDALLARCALLGSDALRQRLEQGRHEPLIREILGCPRGGEHLLHLLAERLGSDPEADENAALLARTLRALRVVVLRKADFCPSLDTIEAGDVERVVSEFREFLHAGLRVKGGDDEAVVLRLE